MKKFIFVVLIALTSQAFAGVFLKDDWEKDDCPKRHSLAWCVVKASAAVPEKEYLIKDAKLSPEDFKALESFGQQSLKDAVVVTTGAVASYMSLYKMSAGTATSAVLSDPGFNFMLGMELLNSLLFNGNEMRDIRIFAWLPSNQPIEDAQVQFAKTYTAAVTEALGFTKSEIIQFGAFTPTLGFEERPLKELAVDGGPCNDARCVLLESDRMYGYEKALRGGYSANRENPPAFISSSSPLALSWSFGSSLPRWYLTSSMDCKLDRSRRVCKNRKLHRFSIEQFRQISEKLPSTAFIFVGIEPDVNDSIPVVLNQGKVLFFVTEKN